MPSGEGWTSTILLAAAIWAVTFLLRRATRERDTFGVVCSVLAVLVALAGWLLTGVSVR
jgi:hypothetical protein